MAQGTDASAIAVRLAPRARHLAQVPGARPMRVVLSVAIALAVLALVSSPAMASAIPSVGSFQWQLAHGVHSANECSRAVAPGVAHCDALVRTDLASRAEHPTWLSSTTPNLVGNGGAYDPSFLQSAYNVPAAWASGGGGSGQIVALIEAYDDPLLGSDLAAYRAHFGLPVCASGAVTHSATGCVFEKVNQRGHAMPLPSPSVSWASEASLDVEMVSAICPKCELLVVEASSPLIGDLGAAVDTAVALGANVVSNSYGTGEYPGENTDANLYYNHPGVAIVASSGDAGYGVEFPAASPTVTAVGGTTLAQYTNSGVRNGLETVWAGSGSGCSQYEPKPSWQNDAGCARRTVSDVAAVANPATGVWVYDTYGNSGYQIMGGTSVSTPIIGALYALAGNTSAKSTPMASLPYAARRALVPVTAGANAACGSYLCDAAKSVAGYNGPTGLGTPGASPSSLAAFSLAGAGSHAPGAPTLTNAVPGTGAVTLKWSAPASSGSSPVSGYNIFVGSSPGGESLAPANKVPVASTSFSVTGLSSAATYYFTIKAINQFWSSTASNELAASPGSDFSVPGAPTLVSAAPGAGSAVLAWGAPANLGGGVSGYNVYVGTLPGAESTTPVNSSPVAATNFAVTGLGNGITYYFTVRAVNSAGQSVPSNQLSARPVSPTSAPQSLVASTVRHGGVSLSWRAPASSGGSSASTYIVLRSTASGAESPLVNVACSQSTCSFNDASGARGVTYYYEVSAANAGGVSSPSNEASATAG
jgi:hypothetical protein